jgi:hypothetical protein
LTFEAALTEYPVENVDALTIENVSASKRMMNTDINCTIPRYPPKLYPGRMGLKKRVADNAIRRPAKWPIKFDFEHQLTVQSS